MRVTFGRYIPTNSIIHKMDPRMKLFMILLLIVSVFFPIGFTGYIILSATILTLFAASKLSWRMLLTLLAPVGIIFFVIFLINIFMMHPSADNINTIVTNASSIPNLQNWNVTFSSSDYIYGFIGPSAWSNVDMNNLDPKVASAFSQMVSLGHFVKWKVFWVSEKALYSAFMMGWRIYLMITLTTILTGSTQPLELTLAIEDLLYPLKMIGIPIYILSMIISIALRMIPTLIDEAGRIMKAQSSRGIDIKNGKSKDKVKGLTSLIIPLLVSAFQKAEDLAYAMDARGYDPHAKRTRYIQFKFRGIDVAIFLAGIAIATFIITYSFVFPVSEAFLHIPYVDQLLS
ncbi:cobalt ABC transporter permease [Williamsoniiplasma somnilux]|uniref:Cobalt ABC transporter permease n=1 Tax=Williamsoniiplasma somnilux TaxID=215578 RepID=A0A2K8P0M3_9MOLU|nr:energy-coupling factor transporter transmembrane component T [Williamsoniiplasma somnilux]ATZ18551.1 cobalt ABC transporter permease [Williamsoniiplasma somnilux]